MMFPGNGSRLELAIHQPPRVRVVDLILRVRVPAEAEKSPIFHRRCRNLRGRAVIPRPGIVDVSYPNMKNVLLRPLYSFGSITGPADREAGRLNDSHWLSRPSELLKKSFAQRLCLVERSSAVPWISLVPDRIIRLVTPPSVLPTAASKVAVWTRTRSACP